MKFKHLNWRLRQALIEDEAFHDITTKCLHGYKDQVVDATIFAKGNGIFCGAFLLNPIFHYLDKNAHVKIFKSDGQKLKKGDVVARIRAKAKAALGGERLFLSLSCHLSGVATLTSKYVEAVKGTHVKILDTRKTTPLWRDLEKYAVTCGGGHNHRISLKDAILVKDNHIHYLRSRGLSPSQIYHQDQIKDLKKQGAKFVLMEAKTYEDVWEGIKARADIILLDNMTVEKIKGSRDFILAARKAIGTATPLIEISGGVTIPQARRYARLGVDRISVGALTHSAPALDLSMEVG